MLLENVIELSQDPFGNFAVQKIIEVTTPEKVQLIAKEVAKVAAQLSLQKFASNVMDKLVPHFEFFDSLGVKDLVQMIQSQFGNLVLQNILNNLASNGPLTD